MIVYRVASCSYKSRLYLTSSPRWRTIGFRVIMKRRLFEKDGGANRCGNTVKVFD